MNVSPGRDAPNSIPVVPINSLPPKQGQGEDNSAPVVPTGAGPAKVIKQPSTVAPAQTQPPRNKQRNLVAPRSTPGYGNGAGLGKVFYFLDQMRNEVTDADRTIKSLQKDMKFMREKNKELEAKNRELERRLREEQALRETAQAKLKALKKKGRDERNSGEAEEENATQKNQTQRKTRPNDSPEKGTSSAVEAKKVPNGGKGKPISDVASSTSGRQPASTNSSSRQQTRGASPLSGTKPMNTIAEKNLAELEAKKSNSAVPPKVSKPHSNGKALPPVARQGTNEKIDTKAKAMGQAQAELQGAPSSPNRPKPQTTNANAEKLLSQNNNSGQGVQENRGATGNGPAVGRAPQIPLSADPKGSNKTSSAQRPANGGPKIPSAIEFDPLKSATPSEVNLSLDANGRSTPVDMQSVSSSGNNAGFTSAEVALGGNGSFAIHSQYSQPFDVSAGLLGQTQMAAVVGITPAAGLMSYQQANGTYQGATMMQVTPQSLAQPTNDSQNAGMSLLQQPFLHVSDQSSIHSMPVADLTQPMILIQPQHVRGVSMHDFAPEAIQLNGVHHSRGASLHTIQNLNPSWNQNGQWASTNNNMGQQQQQQQQYTQQLVPPSDPFDELVSRRPVSAMNTNGK